MNQSSRTPCPHVSSCNTHIISTPRNFFTATETSSLWNGKEFAGYFCLLLGRAWAIPTLAGLHCKTRVYVCFFVAMYCKFKMCLNYFLEIEVQCPRTKQCWVLPEFSVGNHSGDSPSSSMYGTLLLICHGSYGPTINGWLLADRTNYTHQVEIAGFR